MVVVVAVYILFQTIQASAVVRAVVEGLMVH
jgi:hypothetical protein